LAALRRLAGCGAWRRVQFGTRPACGDHWLRRFTRPFQDAVAIAARLCGARLAASNFSVSWVPSQNGFVPEPPQRHRKIVVCSVRSYSFPSASTTLAGPSIRKGPLSVGVILTVVMG